MSVVLATGLGPSSIEPDVIVRIVLSHIMPDTAFSAWRAGLPRWSPGQDVIVWLIRLPRVVLAGVVGASLAMVGSALQAVTGNRLADPHLLGVSSGATLGAVVATLFLGAIWGPSPYR